jgi:hypothetical protein
MQPLSDRSTPALSLSLVYGGLQPIRIISINPRSKRGTATESMQPPKPAFRSLMELGARKPVPADPVGD